MLRTAVRVLAQAGQGEDRAAIVAISTSVVFVVADGAGGWPGGAEAADMVVRLVHEIAGEQFDWSDAETWRQLLARIDEAIEQDAEAGETTAVVACVTGDRIIGASVGDSEAWLVTASEAIDLTRHQQRKPFLGTGVAWPQPFQIEGTPGTLLIGSDGLFKYAGDDAICAAARVEPLDDAADALISLVRLPSGGLCDDVSLVLYRLGFGAF